MALHMIKLCVGVETVDERLAFGDAAIGDAGDEGADLHVAQRRPVALPADDLLRQHQ